MSEIDFSSEGDIDAIFMCGGHGTCVDFHSNPALKAAIETMYNSKKIVAAVCHGPVSLVDCVERVDGKEGRGQQVQVCILVFPFYAGCIVVWLDFEAVVAQIGGDSEQPLAL